MHHWGQDIERARELKSIAESVLGGDFRVANQNSSVFEDYLRDLGTLIREMAVEAKAKAEGSGRNPFDVGYMAGFHRVVSLMQQQAEAFNVPVERLGLDGLDPDEDLV